MSMPEQVFKKMDEFNNDLNKEESTSNNTDLFPLITNIPEPNQFIYVPDHIEYGKGIENINGGWAKVSTIQSAYDLYGNLVHYISVQEFPSNFMKWENNLDNQQENLRERFKNIHAHLNPDLKKESNYLIPKYRLP